MNENLPIYTIPNNIITLDDCAAEINRIWTTAIFEIGEILLRVKESLPHGQFIPWVEKNCPFARQQANNYMRVTRRKEEFLEPPTNLKEAVSELRRIDQMGSRVPISTEVLAPIDIIDPSTRGLELQEKLQNQNNRYMAVLEEEIKALNIPADKKTVYDMYLEDYILESRRFDATIEILEAKRSRLLTFAKTL